MLIYLCFQLRIFDDDTTKVFHEGSKVLKATVVASLVQSYKKQRLMVASSIQQVPVCLHYVSTGP